MSKGTLYVADKTRIWKIDANGKASEFVKADAFPQRPLFLNDLAVDGSGNLYVSDSGDIEKGGKGAIYRITPAGKVSLLISAGAEREHQEPERTAARKLEQLAGARLRDR